MINKLYTAVKPFSVCISRHAKLWFPKGSRFKHVKTNIIIKPSNHFPDTKKKVNTDSNKDSIISLVCLDEGCKGYEFTMDADMASNVLEEEK